MRGQQNIKFAIPRAQEKLLNPILNIYSNFDVLAAEEIEAAVCWVTTLFSLSSGYVI
jgi:hypothetical protein